MIITEKCKIWCSVRIMIHHLDQNIYVFEWLQNVQYRTLSAQCSFSHFEDLQVWLWSLWHLAAIFWSPSSCHVKFPILPLNWRRQSESVSLSWFISFIYLYINIVMLDCYFIFCFIAALVMYLNSMSVSWTTRIQNFLTFSKLLAIAIIIVPGLYLLFKGI